LVVVAVSIWEVPAAMETGLGETVTVATVNVRLPRLRLPRPWKQAVRQSVDDIPRSAATVRKPFMRRTP
jgi:hypothetical protein